MNSIRYHLELGATAAFTKIFMEDTKGLGQRTLKGLTGCFFLLDSWLSLKKAAKSDVSIVVYFIVVVKTSTKVFSKAKIEGLTKYWSDGS